LRRKQYQIYSPSPPSLEALNQGTNIERTYNARKKDLPAERGLGLVNPTVRKTETNDPDGQTMPPVGEWIKREFAATLMRQPTVTRNLGVVSLFRVKSPDCDGSLSL